MQGAGGTPGGVGAFAVGLGMVVVGAYLLLTRVTVGSDGLAIGIDRYGASAPAKDLAEFFGFTPEKIFERIHAAGDHHVGHSDEQRFLQHAADDLRRDHVGRIAQHAK